MRHVRVSRSAAVVGQPGLSMVLPMPSYRRIQGETRT